MNILIKQKIFHLSAGLSLFLSLNPYLVWGKGAIVWYLSVISTTFFFFIAKPVITKRALELSIFYLFFTFYLGMSFELYHIGASGPFNLILGLLVIITFRDITEVYRYYKIIFCISLVPGLIVWWLLFFKVDITAEILVAKNTAKTLNEQFYYQYPGSIFLNYTKYPVGQFEINRFSGMLDEPGFLGTIIALMLCAEKLDLSNKLNRLLLLSGFLTLSAAFFVLVIGYTLLLSKFRVKVGIFVLILLVFVLTAGIPGLEYLIHNKVLNVLSGETNRNSFTMEYFFENLFSDGYIDLIFGFGYGAFSNLGYDASSILVLLYDRGWLSLFLLMIYFVLLFRLPNVSFNYASMVFLIIYAISLYQRPSFMFGSMIVIMFFGVNSKVNERYKGFNNRSIL